jgi:hypothetical protein
MSKSSIIAFTAAGLLFGLLALTVTITAAPREKHCCEKCGVPAVERLHPDATTYYCNGCMREWHGPARYDFSWLDSVEWFAGSN